VRKVVMIAAMATLITPLLSVAPVAAQAQPVVTNGGSKTSPALEAILKRVERSA
jgi:hypothetical protein